MSPHVREAHVLRLRDRVLGVPQHPPLPLAPRSLRASSVFLGLHLFSVDEINQTDIRGLDRPRLCFQEMDSRKKPDSNGAGAVKSGGRLSRLHRGGVPWRGCAGGRKPCLPQIKHPLLDMTVTDRIIDIQP